MGSWVDEGVNGRGGSVYVAAEIGSGLQLHLLRYFLHGGWRLAL